MARSVSFINRDMETFVTKSDVPRMLDTAAAAEALGVSKSWLEKSRLTGEGPPFVSIGGRRLYAVIDLNGWLDQRRRSSTSETIVRMRQLP